MNTIPIDVGQENACEYDYIPMNIVMHTRKPILWGKYTDRSISVSHVPGSITMQVTWHR